MSQALTDLGVLPIKLPEDFIELEVLIKKRVECIDNTLSIIKELSLMNDKSFKDVIDLLFKYSEDINIEQNDPSKQNLSLLKDAYLRNVLPEYLPEKIKRTIEIASYILENKDNNGKPNPIDILNLLSIYRGLPLPLPETEEQLLLDAIGITKNKNQDNPANNIILAIMTCIRSIQRDKYDPVAALENAIQLYILLQVGDDKHDEVITELNLSDDDKILLANVLKDVSSSFSLDEGKIRSLESLLNKGPSNQI